MHSIRVVQDEPDLRACFPLMKQLRTHLTEDEFVRRVQAQGQELYELAALDDDDGVKAIAGFRFFHCLAWGRVLYVDDLITAEDARSRGYGRALLNWLVERARREGCDALHLDSGVQREAAHRFYFREGLVVKSFHFSRKI